jgi:hypothetical protein
LDTRLDCFQTLVVGVVIAFRIIESLEKER